MHCAGRSLLMSDRRFQATISDHLDWGGAAA
jgi:hypothetical protein